MGAVDQTRRALGVVSIIQADNAWPKCFECERDRLRPILGVVAADLQHFGSTAIPGLAAKPVIDMMGPVSDLCEADVLADDLRAAGYQMIDAGFSKRRFFRKEAEVALPAYHLHLAIAPTWPVKNELLFRDWLIAHPNVTRPTKN